ncbi:MAG: CvpA family protein [Chloroflexota bacterium]|nr:CvpA family protein [Chloroflexota bacterium]
MNWLDIVIVVIGIIFGFLGLWKGAIKAAFSIIGLIGGIALAGHFYQSFANVLSSSGAPWAKIAAYAIILIAVWVLVNILGWFIARLVHVTPFGWVDRLIGFILGAGIGLLLVSALLAIASKYLPGMEATIASSTVAKFLMARLPLLLALLPDEFDFIRDFFYPSGHTY